MMATKSFAATITETDDRTADTEKPGEVVRLSKDVLDEVPLTEGLY